MQQAWAGSISRIAFAVLLLDAARVAVSHTSGQSLTIGTVSAVQPLDRGSSGDALPAWRARLDNVQQVP